MGAGRGRGATTLAGTFVCLLLGAVPAAAAAAPRAVITVGPESPTSDSAATFSFEASGPAILPSFECRVDGATWVACSSPRRLDGLGGGGHRFEVRLAGPLADPTPAARDWTVELRTVATPGAPSGAPLQPALNPAPVAPVRGDGGCADGGARPGQVSSGALARAVLCLLNDERRLRGLRPLRASAPLTLAARRHASDMVRRRYFAHVSPAGATLGDRAARTGYLRGASGWSLGEVLAWTDHARATPRTAVQELMHSAPHRRIILTPAYRQVGISVLGHAPLPGVRRGATFVADFGRVG
jgi:uncharacterized protein YkwD